ncbi:latent-transforming growth factor beta-binding protein 2-like isoform X2 [Hydra vulgaris]|uniref:Latent-transforming growth factor beta-binding protein 2-like isoform X2 n=1 Tax=Hydra vulgaris TaxID=6087 RepID=A0ABM4DLB5_HYDVU
MFLINSLLVLVPLFKNVYGSLESNCKSPKVAYDGIIFEKLGCWEDKQTRALKRLGDFETNPLYNCYIQARNENYEIFSLQFNHQCWAGNGISYQMFGRSNKCNLNGRGGTWANEVYKVNNDTLDINKTEEFRNVLRKNCSSYQPTSDLAGVNNCTKPCFWSHSVCINQDECFICTCDTTWNLGKDVFSCVKSYCKPQLTFTYNAVLIESFLDITFQINYWNLDEPAVNVSWEYFFPPFIILQYNYTSVNVVYSDSKLLQYKVMKLSEVGVNQSIVALINNINCFSCESDIVIPIKLYFENSAGFFWRSFQILRKNLKENCTSHVLQNYSPDITHCTKTCTWKSSICKYEEECFLCTCETGWKMDIDECTVLNKPCNWVYGVFKNTNGSYLCACESGWFLDKNDDSCVDINECTAFNQPCNWTNGVCININGSYLCACESGWFLDKNNGSCFDINECTAFNKPCNWTNGVCINTNGSYLCACESGWLLDKNNDSCVDINECTAFNKPCNWTNGVCINTNGSYVCACESGWLLDKNNDSCDAECTTLNNPCNRKNAACINNSKGYECIEGEWNIWSECSQTCGLGYKISYLRTLLPSKQNVKRFDMCMYFKCPVDWKWSSWLESKSFSNSCGNCLTKRERFCTNSLSTDLDVGYNCFGLNQDFQNLEIRICPVHGGWTQWSFWSYCSQPCQGGKQTRRRSCNNPLPKYGGKQCNGTDTEHKTCCSDECKNVIVNLNLFFNDEDYIEVYSDPTNKPSEMLKYKIENAMQNLYKKLNKSVQFDLVLNSLKDEEESQ